MLLYCILLHYTRGVSDIWATPLCISCVQLSVVQPTFFFPPTITHPLSIYKQRHDRHSFSQESNSLKKTTPGNLGVRLTRFCPEDLWLARHPQQICAQWQEIITPEHSCHHRLHSVDSPNWNTCQWHSEITASEGTWRLWNTEIMKMPQPLWRPWTPKHYSNRCCVLEY